MSQQAASSSASLDKIPTDAFSLNKTPVEYIVIGSGAGGGPLAARLALGGMRVLVLEQGEDVGAAVATEAAENESAIYHCPGLHEASTEAALHGARPAEDAAWPQYVRHYHDDARQQRDPKAVLAEEYNHERRQLYPRARALGGCTAHHAMIAITPPDEDWRYIAELTGDESWQPEAMRLMFRRLERHSRGKHLTWLGSLWHGLLDKWNPDRHLAGRRGDCGWLDISFTDPKLALGDRRLARVIKNAALATEPSHFSALRRWMERIAAGRFYQDLDLNDSRTMRNSAGGVCLLPLAVSSGAGSPHSPRPNMRRGPREFLLETRAALLRARRAAADTDSAIPKADGTQPLGEPAEIGPDLATPRVANPALQGTLWLVTGVSVSRIVFHKDAEHPAPRAVGVEIRRSTGETEICFTRREVICCGGAFATPQLLMLSGIGPEKHLTDNGIQGLRDENGKSVCENIALPGVGQNLGDRYEVSVISETDQDWPALANASFTPTMPDEAFELWKKTRGGIYATNGGVIGILHKSSIRWDEEAASANIDHLTGRPHRLAPDIFMMGFPAAFRGYYPGWSFDLLKKHVVFDDTAPPPLQPGTDRNLWSWTILKAWSRNTGEVRLRSADPCCPPDINFHYFERRQGKDWIFSLEDPDLAALTEAIAVVRRINRSAAKLMRGKNADAAELQPGTGLRDDSKDLREWIAAEAWGHHACGTCRIGQDRWQDDASRLIDQGAVLDSQFRVHGVAGLRVVDASVFPKIPGYFLAVPTFMVAEKAAETILTDGRQLPREMRAAEVEALHRRRRRARTQIVGEDGAAQTDGDDYALPPQTVGLALSGGGIRSATFCLGLIQSLAKANRLREIDYLSTASGGGYAGAFLGALLQRLGPDQRLDPLGSAQPVIADHHSSPLRWLRTKAMYLVSDGNADWWQWLSVYWRNLMAVHAVMLAFAIAVFGTLRAISDFIPTTGLLEGSGSTFGQASLLQQSLQVVSPWWIVVLGWFITVLLPSAIAYWLSPHIGSTGQISFFAMLYWTVLLVCLVIAAVLPGGLWLASGALIAAVLGLFWFFAVGLFASSEDSGPDGLSRSAGQLKRNRLTRAMSVATMSLAFMALFLVIDTLARLIAEGRLTSLLPAWAAVVAPFIPFLRWFSTAPLAASHQNAAAPSDRFPRIAMLLALALLGLAFTATDALVHFAFNADWQWGFALTAFGLALSFAVGHAMEFLNGSTLLNLYSARLARTFLGAANPARWGERNDPLQNVLRFHETDDMPLAHYHPEDAGGPLHLIGVCVNETVDVSSQREVADRRSLPMCVSPLGVSVGLRFHALWEHPGEEVAPVRSRIRKWLNGFESNQEIVLRAVGPPEAFHVLGSRNGRVAFTAIPTLAFWIAISGAAFGTGLGRRTTKATSILAGLANARLGYWWDTGLRRGERRSVAQGNIWQRLKRIPTRLFPMQSLLLAELVGRFGGPSEQYWHLSDGGHFDNTAVYELIRRRVPLILAVDGSADPKLCFEDLANLVRNVRIDYGADLSFLNGGGDPRVAKMPGWVRSWFCAEAIGSLDDVAAGRCHAAIACVTWEDSPNQTAWLIYIKSSVTGDEDRDLLHFKKTNSSFPWEPTTDQFFSEAQWESYRKLGQHIGNIVIRQ